MKIYLDEKNSVEVSGNVIWNQIKEDGRYAGIHFDTATTEFQQEILNYAFEVKHDDVVNHWFSGWGQQPDDSSQ